MSEDSGTKQDLLYIKDFGIYFKDDDRRLIVLQDVNAIIKQGEVVAIVGESGAGKSLLCRSIMKLLPKSAIVSGGKIFFKEKWDILNINNSEIYKLRGREMAMIFQDPLAYINPVLTCGAQIAESVRLSGKSADKNIIHKTFELLSKVGIVDVERIYYSYPHQLSGGQLQRVMIAMALAGNPSLILADEPTTALDVTHQEQILHLLKSINVESKTTIVLVTHDLSMARRIADRVFVMNRGTIVESGSSEDVFKHPKHIYTKALLMCKPPISRKYKILPTVPSILENQDRLDRFAPAELVVSEYEINERLNFLNNQKLILKVNDLSFTYKSFLSQKRYSALDKISFSLKRGECLGIVGESGSGKTTLAQCISGLLSPSNKESVQFFDNDECLLNFPDRKSLTKFVQYIFQNTFDTLDPRQAVLDGLVEVLIHHRIRPNRKTCREYATDILTSLYISSENLNKLPHEFSAGQRQRIVLARALAIQPELLICDEPVSSLDVSIQAEILNLLKKRVVESNLSCIFISHDISTVRYLADTILVLKNGRVEEIGETERLLADSKSDYTRSLIKSAS